eukprot:7030004-Alexandrium_andersonii.AAC.1
MSASLVGSEMCIRDSLHAHGSLSRGRLSKGSVLLKPQSALNEEEALRVRPVSYTHLTLPTICSV